VFGKTIARQRLIVATKEGDDELAFHPLLFAFKDETGVLTLTENGKHL
jgi:hypothetical protein